MGATITTVTHKQAVIVEEYVAAMSRAESNFAKGGVNVYVAARQNREAAEKARLVNNDMLKVTAAVKSYHQFMSLKQSDLEGAHFMFGHHVPVYKSYEQAALVAEENGLGVEMKLSAAKKAVSNLVENVNLMKPDTSWHQGMLRVDSLRDAVVNLSEAGRIVKRFELGQEESKKVEDATEGYKSRVGEQISNLIRQDYSSV
jgi:hypothetical protein